MLRKLKEHAREKESRRFFAVYLVGKMLGVVLLLVALKVLAPFFHSVAGAQSTTDAPSPEDIVNPMNTVWVLVAAFLVFFMQAGFMMLEAGFARTRESVNILLECIVDTACAASCSGPSASRSCSATGNGWIGHEFFFLNGAPATYGTTGVAFMAFFLFQFAFADTCSTITSGAMVGRTGFKGDLLYSIGVSGFIYPIIGHWIWGPDGWLATMDTPFRDFAGSTVVHTVGGMVALAGAIALGPRLGRKFKRDGGGMPPGHDMTIAAVGGVILWFGWYGFNPGSHAVGDGLRGHRPGGHQHHAGRLRRRLVGDVLRLSRAQEVGHRHHRQRLPRRPGGHHLSLLLGEHRPGAIIIGAIAGVVVVLGVDLIEWLRIDDPIGAVPVHGFCGIWGTLSLGLFATGQFGVPGPTGADTTTVVTGLFYGGGCDQLWPRSSAARSSPPPSLVAGLGPDVRRQATGTLRVSEEGELEGIDIHEHGAPAYHPEFGFMGVAGVGSGSTGGAGTPAPAGAMVSRTPVG